MKRLISKLMNKNSLGSDELMLLSELEKGLFAATILPGTQTYYQAHDGDGRGLVIETDLDHVNRSLAENASVDGARSYDYLRILTVTDGYLTHVDGEAICSRATYQRAECVCWEFAYANTILEPLDWLLDLRESERCARLEIRSFETKIAKEGNSETLSKKLTRARAWLARCRQNLQLMANAQVMVFGAGEQQ